MQCGISIDKADGMHEHFVNVADWGLWDWLCYFVYGNGLWGNAWTCTHGDACALGFRALACVYMSTQYFRYAWQWRNNFDPERESPTKTHSQWLRAVFVWCVVLHLVGSILFIFVPVHYIMGVLFLVNGIQAQMLCASNLQMLTHNRWREGESAIEAQDKLSVDIAEANRLVLEQEQHAMTVDMVNDTSRTLSAVRDVLEVARMRLDQTRKTKVAAHD